MRLTTALLSVDDDANNYNFVPHVVRYWKRIGVQVIVVFVGDAIPQSLEAYASNMRLWNKTPHLDSVYVAQHVRLYYAALLHAADDELVLVTDVHTLPLSHAYFKDGLHECAKEDFVHWGKVPLAGREHLHPELSLSLTCGDGQFDAAHPDTWRQVTGVNNEDDVVRRLNEHANAESEVVYDTACHYRHFRQLQRQEARLSAKTRGSDCLAFDHHIERLQQTMLAYTTVEFDRNFSDNVARLQLLDQAVQAYDARFAAAKCAPCMPTSEWTVYVQNLQADRSRVARLEQALYASDDGVYADVTDIVAGMQQANTSTMVSVNDSTMAGDPHPGVSKRLYLRWQLEACEDRIANCAAEENSTLCLPPTRQTPFYGGVDVEAVPLDRKLDELFDGKVNGFYIDIGANDGLTQSNTAYFEFHRGWTGVLIEPSALAYAKCVTNRPNSTCLNCACVGPEYRVATIEGDFDGDLMSSVGATMRLGCGDTKNQTHTVRARTMESCLDAANVTHIDFMSLDTEGYELDVLRGMNLEKYRPAYVLIKVYTNDYEAIQAYLQSFNYKCVQSFTNYSREQTSQSDGTRNDYLFRRIDAVPPRAPSFNIVQRILSCERILERCDVSIGYESSYHASWFHTTRFYGCRAAVDILYDRPQHVVTYTSESPLLLRNVRVFVFGNCFRQVMADAKIKFDQCKVYVHGSDVNVDVDASLLQSMRANGNTTFYVQNLRTSCCDEDSAVCRVLPIGIANSLYPHGDVDVLHRHICASLERDKTQHVFFNFTLSTNRAEREKCYDQVSGNTSVRFVPFFADHGAYLDALSQHRYCICPEGNGSDCHRTWECLYLGVIPIMLRTPFSERLARHVRPHHYIHLLNEWTDLDEAELLAKYTTYRPRARTFSCLLLDDYIDDAPHTQWTKSVTHVTLEADWCMFPRWIADSSQIVRAAYCSEKVSGNVTKRVREIYERGERVFRVTNDSMGGDVDVMQRKKLSVVYSLHVLRKNDNVSSGAHTCRGQNVHVRTFAENSVARFDFDSHHLLAATYASTKVDRDVTSVLKRYLENGRRSFVVSNTTMHGDADPGHAKFLQIEYEEHDARDGEERRKSYAQDMVSVIIPSYNRFDLLNCAIRSALKQTHTNLEIIVVDDCSDDPRYKNGELERYDKTRVVHLQHRIHRALVRNVGMRMAKGQWIAFLDDDDMFVNTKLKTQLEALEQTDCLMSGTKMSFVHRTSHTDDDAYVVLGHSGPCPERVTLDIMQRSCYMHNSTVVMHTSIFQKVGMQPPVDNEDYMYWKRALEYTDSLHVDLPLVIFTQTSDARHQHYLCGQY